MGDGHALTKKPSRIFSSEREVPHIRLGDETALDRRYHRGEKLGQGTFGTVYKGVGVDSSDVVAIKVVNREKAGSANIKLLEREIGILKTVSHENIIRLNEVYESQSKIFLIMEYCDRGELSELWRVSKQMEEGTVKIILKRLASAISYLHINGIVHRDLKMENILVCTNPADPKDQFFIKVTDFGLSVIKGGMGPENMLSSFCGTPAYMAPEIILNKSYSESCDNWAIGCITFALLTGQLPFYSKDDDKLYDSIKFTDPDWQLLPKGTSNDAKLCLRKLLSKDPANRLTAGELTRHPWLTGEAGTATPSVLDLMHDFLAGNIKDEDEVLVEEGSETTFGTTKIEENTRAAGSRGSESSSGGLRLCIHDTPVREHSNDSNSHNVSSAHSQVSRQQSKASSLGASSTSIKKSPSDHEFESSSVINANKKHHAFETSLPASTSRNLFANPRNHAASVTTPRQVASSKVGGSNTSVSKQSHSNSSSNMSSKPNSLATSGLKSKKS